ncbi:MAG: hypothetical protein ACI35Q_10470 [Marinilabiliaceae bacterium]
MKKTFTLFFAALAATSAMAQMHGALSFAGKANTTVLTTNIASESDTVVFRMSSASTGDITFPEIKGGDMPTIPSFTVKDATFTMGANHVVTFDEQTFSSAVTVDEDEKKIEGTSLTGEYNMADNSLTLKSVFKYGSMPIPLTYEVKAYYVKEVTGGIKVVVGGTFTYKNESVTYKFRKYDNEGVETLDVEVPQYSLKGTLMGDLTLGHYVISGLTYDAAKGGYYRDYKGDGLKFHFTAESNGTKTMDNDYAFNAEKENNIHVTYDSKGQVASVVNTFQMGAMPFPIVSTFPDKGGSASIGAVVAPEAQNDGFAYDLSGRRVGSNAKGIVIKNGKKYFVK